MRLHRRVLSPSTTSQLSLWISKMPRSRTRSATDSGSCGDTKGVPSSRAPTRLPRFPRNMARGALGDPQKAFWEEECPQRLGRVPCCPGNRAGSPREAGLEGGAAGVSPALGLQCPPWAIGAQEKFLSCEHSPNWHGRYCLVLVK